LQTDASNKPSVRSSGSSAIALPRNLFSSKWRRLRLQTRLSPSKGNRHGKRTHCPCHSQRQSALQARFYKIQLRGHFRWIFWKANCSVMRRALSQVRWRSRSDSSKWLIKTRSFCKAIACMPTRPWSASPAPIRRYQPAGHRILLEKTEPSPQPLAMVPRNRRSASRASPQAIPRSIPC
jgi:hypothetical protein